jgi:hypothetical protein
LASSQLLAFETSPAASTRPLMLVDDGASRKPVALACTTTFRVSPGSIGRLSTALVVFVLVKAPKSIELTCIVDGKTCTTRPDSVAVSPTLVTVIVPVIESPRR